MTPIRLDKHLAALLGCSRGDARQYIEGGWVRVDGETVDAPQHPIDGQQVVLAPDARLGEVAPATLLLHKPAGIDSEAAIALATPASRSGLDMLDQAVLRRHFHRLAAPMPLDAEASGLLVLTQDHRARRRLTEDTAHLEQEYIVEVEGTLPPYALAQLSRGGLDDNGWPLPPCKVSRQSEQRLRFAIKQVRPGQLQRMCAQVGLRAVGIKRLRIGRIGLAKMDVGTWRYLPPGERF
ncbi:rRNA pseudouridine synthase [Luteimonas sp. BDR2-5]|uniref:rRNA pseudouridine synthase n=1 Tax=Proluteimonas luteida TaxID=2878685 RepID=UPI001E472DF5|nr:rRNA pseudouridine synthase [Luteimonas sp. BDR2-5]MCD9026659.1 rRNA pseudouridine synthase [Luteimonas sp. BDR2-5]